MKFLVVTVGTGGTGSYFLKEFSRFCSVSKKGKDIYNLLIDGDVVEQKNLSRQNFFQDSVGKNKAEDMQELISETYPNVNVMSYPRFLLKTSDMTKAVNTALKELFAHRNNNEQILPIVVGAVDNHRCRQVLEEWFESQPDVFYIDSANEMYDGEVVFSSKMRGSIYSPLRSEYFPDVATDTSPNVAEMSCSELNNAAPQHISTNMLAGNIILSAVLQLIEENVLKDGMVFFSTKKLYMEYVPYRKVTLDTAKND